MSGVGALFAYAFAMCAILLFASLAAVVTERSGVTNIGIEGMMTLGALFTSILGTFVNKNNNGNWTQIWVVLIGGLVVGLFALLHGFAAITLGANQIISSTAINILASGISLFLATAGWFGPSSNDISSGYKIIQFGNIFPMWLLIAILTACCIGIFFKFTRNGMRYTMTGENPNAVAAAGLSVVKIRYLAVFFSGVLAGISGGVLICTPVGSGTFLGTTYGLGFLAIAIMIFGQWRVSYISIGVILFALLFALGNRLGLIISQESEMKNWARLFMPLPFVLTIIAMIFFSKSSKVPAALGIPFESSKS